VSSRGLDRRRSGPHLERNSLQDYQSLTALWQGVLVACRFTRIGRTGTLNPAFGLALHGRPRWGRPGWIRDLARVSSATPPSGDEDAAKSCLSRGSSDNPGMGGRRRRVVGGGRSKPVRGPRDALFRGEGNRQSLTPWLQVLRASCRFNVNCFPGTSVLSMT
jgi:hypothetical protein